MKGQFVYNPKTGTLHIKDYCHHTKGICSGYLFFDSENEVLAYDGRSIRMCKICQNKREEYHTK